MGKGLFGAVFFALLSTCLLRGQTLTLVTMTNTLWKYYEAGNAPPTIDGVAWNAPGYNDTAWASGLGVFGEESDTLPQPIQTRLQLIAPGTNVQTITYYFRTHFNFPTNPTRIELIFTNLLDDGAVVYLNGAPLYRYRLPPSYTYATFASTAPLEGVYEYTNVVASAHLREGDNVLAVELHQAAATSADVIFGLSAHAVPVLPIVITKQPESQTVIDRQFQPWNFTTEVTGSHPKFQWFKNEMPLAGWNSSNTPPLIPQLSYAGSYYLVVSNAISTATSQVAVLNVIPDTFGPVPSAALVEETWTNMVDLVFNERIPSRTDSGHVTNYSVQIVGESSVITVLEAVANQNRARLTVAPNWDRTKNYYIVFHHLTDFFTNAIKPNTQIGIRFITASNLLTQSDTWKWTTSSNLPPEWKTNGYPEDPLLWFEGSVPLYNEASQYLTCMGAIGNAGGNGSLPIGYPSYYFRSQFVLPPNADPAEVTLRIKHLLDDGAIFHVNGLEIFRTNMPNGLISYESRAPLAAEANRCRTNLISGAHLSPGTNVIAVQVHQFAAPDNDVVFGLTMEALFPRGLTIPAISFKRLLPEPPQTAPPLALSWTGDGWSLEESLSAGTNGWSPVPTSGNTYTNVEPNRFFRLKRQ